LHKAIERELDDLRAGLNLLRIKYNAAILRKFHIYLEVLFNMRNKLHLLSHQDYERIAKRHFLTSLMALDFVKGHRFNFADGFRFCERSPPCL
jgi:16S rRNA G527 N7-methylase RsmG